MQRIGDLELDQDLVFEQRQWTAQRIGWCLMLAAMVLGLLGLFGTGPLSSATAGGADDGVTVQYERFVRRGAKASMKLNLHNDPPGFIQFWVSAPYLEKVMVDGVEPVPQTVTVERDRHVYTIRAGSPDVTVTVEMEHQTFGRLEGEAGIVGGPSVRFQHLSLF